MPDTSGATQPPLPHFDVIIVGAGLSGIGAAWKLQKQCPHKTYAILEQRDAIGGTWDLFRYPGIRSDSDMHTLGYDFRPWTEAKAIADGPSIRKYVNDTAHEGGIDQHIRFGHKVGQISFCSESATWTVTATHNGLPVKMTSSFILMCAGYYRYDRGYRPDFTGQDAFEGTFVHPQHWPEELDYAGKQVVVIGSGATAVTIVPEMAKAAAKVTMLQRSPTYVVSRPARDGFANALRKFLPQSWAYNITRTRNVLLQKFFFYQARKHPERTAAHIKREARKSLGADYPVEPHFSPNYDPWDQRLCLIPDGDLFTAIKSGKADIVTDEIETFTPTGMKLKSGHTLEADIVVTATGLSLQFLGGAEMAVDGKTMSMPERLTYRAAMLSETPNMFFVFGYLNASWTLRADLISDFACRMINYMSDEGYDIAMAVADASAGAKQPWLGFSSGYIQRSIDRLPHQGEHGPWRFGQNYTRDLREMKFGRLDDGVMRFSRAKTTVSS